MPCTTANTSPSRSTISRPTSPEPNEVTSFGHSRTAGQQKKGGISLQDEVYQTVQRLQRGVTQLCRNLRRRLGHSLERSIKMKICRVDETEIHVVAQDTLRSGQRARNVSLASLPAVIGFTRNQITARVS